MRKFLITLLLIIGMPVMAVPLRVAPNMYHMKRVVTENAVINCFAYFNVEKAKLNGRVFEMEYNCIYDEGGDIETEQSVFYYGSETDYVYGNPYYFSRENIFKIMMQYDE